MAVAMRESAADSSPCSSGVHEGIAAEGQLGEGSIEQALVLGAQAAAPSSKSRSLPRFALVT